jgi:hypothetical protein
VGNEVYVVVQTVERRGEPKHVLKMHRNEIHQFY